MVKSVDEILDNATSYRNEVRSYVRDGADWFHENEGELFERSEAIAQLSGDLKIDEDIAQGVIAELVGDDVDPIVQVSTDDKYIGVIEFKEFNGAYGYTDYHDIRGKRKRVVCAQCVHTNEFDANVTHATAGDPDGSFEHDASYDDLLSAIHKHYQTAHTVLPDDVETGASLVSGTTIGGNESWHTGNDGATSGLDADTVDANHASSLAKLNIGVQSPKFASIGDVPNTISEGEVVYISGDGLYVEDGT